MADYIQEVPNESASSTLEQRWNSASRKSAMTLETDREQLVLSSLLPHDLMKLSTQHLVPKIKAMI